MLCKALLLAEQLYSQKLGNQIFHSAYMPLPDQACTQMPG